MAIVEIDYYKEQERASEMMERFHNCAVVDGMRINSFEKVYAEPDKLVMIFHLEEVPEDAATESE